MYRELIAGSLTFLCSSLWAQYPSSPIEYCEATKSKGGERYFLGHSSFSEGETWENAKPLRNSKKISSAPESYEFTFTLPIKGSIWLGCTYYNSEKSKFVDHVEIPHVLISCVETLTPGPDGLPGRTQSLQCKKRYFKM